MDLLQLYTGEAAQIETILIFSISFFFFLSLLFLLILFISRYLSNQREKVEKRFQPFVEELLFAIMFEDSLVDDLLKHRLYTRYHTKKVFIKMLNRSCFDMHQQYSGEIAKRLETFYRLSKLKQYSILKLKEGPWYKRCQGIRELSEMNQKDAGADIILLCFSKHQLVKQNAFTAIIKLKGIEGLKDLQNFTEFIDDWTLSHILITIEKTDTSVFPDINFLLQHTNPSMILIALRMIRYYSLAGYQKNIQAIKETATSERLKLEVQKLINMTEFQTTL